MKQKALDINGRVRQIRLALKLTIVQFAQSLSISKSNLGAVELSQIKVNGRLVKLICAVFGVREDWLRTGRGEMFGAPEANEKYKKVEALFRQLGPVYQDHLLKHLNLLLELQEENRKNQGNARTAAERET
jgi:transcriptional regulator with XRE-family HTH domain